MRSRKCDPAQDKPDAVQFCVLKTGAALEKLISGKPVATLLTTRPGVTCGVQEAWPCSGTTRGGAIPLHKKSRRHSRARKCGPVQERQEVVQCDSMKNRSRRPIRAQKYGPGKEKREGVQFESTKKKSRRHPVREGIKAWPC